VSKRERVRTTHLVPELVPGRDVLLKGERHPIVQWGSSHVESSRPLVLSKESSWMCQSMNWGSRKMVHH